MHRYFISVESKDDEGWMMGAFGNSGIDNKDYTLTTNGLRCDQIPQPMLDAKTSTELIAGLLNAYYNGINVADYEEDKVIRMGIVEADAEVPSHLNPVLPFAEEDLEKKIPF